MKVKRQNDDTFTSHCCVNQLYGIYLNFDMYKEAQHGKQHDTGAWGDKQLPLNYHHAIQVQLSTLH